MRIGIREAGRGSWDTAGGMQPEEVAAGVAECGKSKGFRFSQYQQLRLLARYSAALYAPVHCVRGP
jgi:hypothetical protein